MHKIFICTLAVAAIVMFSGCHWGNRFRAFTDDDDNGVNVSTMEVDNGDDYIKVKYAGDIVFTDDETAIKSISPGGCVKYWKNGRRFIAESNKSGLITYKLYDGNANISINDAKGKKFAAVVLNDLINLGFDAKGRVDRLYKKGGATAVLNEIDVLKNQYTKSTYYEHLLNTKYLTPAEMNNVAISIGQTLDGAYEKSQLLGKFADYYMGNALASNTYLDAVNTINADYEKSGTLQTIVKQPLNKDQLGQVIAIAGTINGDYEKAQVLKAIISKAGLVTENCDKLLDVAATVGGDYEKAGILTELVQNDSLSDESFGRLLFVTGHIGGDYEKAGVLTKITEQSITEPDQWVSLIKATAGINAAYEKSNTMVAIAHKMPKDQRVRAAYMDAAKTISSDYEYSQAVKATE